MVLVADAGADPASGWTSYSMTLTENGGWRKTTLSGPPPTHTEFRAVLRSLTMLRIRGEFIDGGDTSGLDNVVLERESWSIDAAKKLPRYYQLNIDKAVVTAVFDDCFYIQDSTEYCGIQVRKDGYTAIAGTVINLGGVMATDSEGERFLGAYPVTVLDEPASVRPVCMANAAIGGSDWCFNPATEAGQEGIPGCPGLNNTGLLIRTCGAITHIDPAGDYIVVWDGSDRVTGDGHRGIRVRLEGHSVPTAGFVTVTGISSRCVIDGKAYPQVRAVLIE